MVVIRHYDLQKGKQDIEELNKEGKKVKKLPSKQVQECTRKG